MTTASTPRTEKGSARERLLAAAGELFYEEGINSVGIDRVIERAGVAKASLYSNFGSKDELIRSYLEAKHDARQARAMDRLARHAKPRDKILGIFDLLADMAKQSDYAGCAFVKAGAELRPDSSGRAVCETSRAWLRELFAGLAKEAGAGKPAQLAQQLVLLYDGASISAQMDGDARAASTARALAAQLLDAAIAG